MGDVISLDDRRKDECAFCLSITVTSDGKTLLEKDVFQLQTREQVNWALAQIALAVHDLVEYKNGLPD